MFKKLLTIVVCLNVLILAGTSTGYGEESKTPPAKPVVLHVNPIYMDSAYATGDINQPLIVEVIINGVKVGQSSGKQGRFSVRIKSQQPNTRISFVVKNNKIIVSKAVVKVHGPEILTGPSIAYYKGAKVEILYENGKGIYRIKCKDGTTKSVSRNLIRITSDPATIRHQLSTIELEYYANKNFKVNKRYYLWVDLARQRTYIFKRVNKKWDLIRNIACATGRNVTPTPRGHYSIRYAKWGFNVLDKNNKPTGVLVKYATNFSGGYYFHSVLLNEKGNVVDPTLGRRASHGCIRLALKDAKFINTSIPISSAVWIE